MADTKITDLTEKATGAATDEFVINDVAGGDADKKLGMDGIRITQSQITDHSFTHAMLSATHTDSNAGAIAEGAIIYAKNNAGPIQWDKLVIGSADAFLRVNGGATAPQWTTAASSDLSDTANIPLLDAFNTFDGLNFFNSNTTFLDSIQVLASTFSPIDSIRSGTATNISREAFHIVHLTSNDMVDDFGVHISLWIDDNGVGEQEIARIGAVRDGADNTGKYVVQIAAAGSFGDALTITAAGVVDWPQTGAHTNFVLDEDGTGNAITNLDVASIKAASSLVEAAIPFVIDGGGSAITTGVKGYIEAPFDCTITQVSLLADVSGAIVVDIWKDTYANYPPTDADSITASAVPEIAASGVKDQDSTLTGWTTAVTKGDIIGFNVDSATSITRCTVSLLVDRT